MISEVPVKHELSLSGRNLENKPDDVYQVAY